MEYVKEVNATLGVLKDMSPKEIILKVTALIIPLLVAGCLLVGIWRCVPSITEMEKLKIERMKVENERLRIQLKNEEKKEPPGDGGNQ